MGAFISKLYSTLKQPSMPPLKGTEGMDDTQKLKFLSTPQGEQAILQHIKTPEYQGALTSKLAGYAGTSGTKGKALLDELNGWRLFPLYNIGISPATVRRSFLRAAAPPKRVAPLEQGSMDSFSQAASQKFNDTMAPMREKGLQLLKALRGN